MYLRFYRFFPSFRPSNADSDDILSPSPSTSSPSSTPTPDVDSPTRTRFSFLSHLKSKKQQQQQQQQQQKTVHWGQITETPQIEPIIEQDKLPHPLHGNPQPQIKPKPKLRHAHARPIRKPPTPLDQEMLHKNLWEMIYQAEEKIRLNYEYLNLSGEGESDDRVLDAWFRVEEQATHKVVNRAAKAQARVQAPSWPKIAKRRQREKRVKACLARRALESEEWEPFGSDEAASKSVERVEAVEAVEEAVKD